MSMELSGQVALVTGAGRGIGRAIALALARVGARVVAAARTVEEIEEVADEILEAGGDAVAIPADVADEGDVQELFARIDEQFGRLDIVVNNAGVGVFGPLAELDPDDFDRMVAVNLRGTFLCCQQAMKRMARRQRGYIINISSVVGFRGYANQSAYAATKHGVMGLTKSLAAEAQAYGVRVSAILPGGVDTDLIRTFRPDLDPSVLLDPQDVAQAVMYLLSLSDQAAVDEIYLRRRASRPF